MTYEGEILAEDDDKDDLDTTVVKFERKKLDTAKGKIDDEDTDKDIPPVDDDTTREDVTSQKSTKTTEDSAIVYGLIPTQYKPDAPREVVRVGKTQEVRKGAKAIATVLDKKDVKIRREIQQRELKEQQREREKQAVIKKIEEDKRIERVSFEQMKAKYAPLLSERIAYSGAERPSFCYSDIWSNLERENLHEDYHILMSYVYKVSSMPFIGGQKWKHVALAPSRLEKIAEAKKKLGVDTEESNEKPGRRFDRKLEPVYKGRLDALIYLSIEALKTFSVKGTAKLRRLERQYEIDEVSYLVRTAYLAIYVSRDHLNEDEARVFNGIVAYTQDIAKREKGDSWHEKTKALSKSFMELRRLYMVGPKYVQRGEVRSSKDVEADLIKRGVIEDPTMEQLRKEVEKEYERHHPSTE